MDLIIKLLILTICTTFLINRVSSEYNRRRLSLSTNIFQRNRGNGGYKGKFWLRDSSDRDDPNNIRFYLFPNASNPDQKEEITFDSSAVKTLSFVKGVQSKFIVHGFIQNLEAEFPQNVKNAYLKRMREKGDRWNIIVVDWGKLAYEVKDGLPMYSRAVRNVEPTGNRTGLLVKFLIDNGLIADLSDVHLVGQSLGAHVVGQCGNWLKSQFNGKLVRRISGLDPAGPLFYTGIDGRKLQTSDAKFVDVYHCNPGGLGIAESVGTIEFYPNGQEVGNIQPQCLRPRKEIEGPLLCSHNYCPKFFALSIIQKIEAKRCDSAAKFNLGWCSNSVTALYGEDVSYMQTGTYYVKIEPNLDDMSIFKD